MAIYHASIKVFSRTQGHSATAAAAYRTARRLRDERTGLTHDYRARRGVAQVMALAPPSAPEWSRDIERLWSAAEIAETRINARVAREFEVALPAELDARQRAVLTQAIAGELVSRYGVAVTAAIHEPGDTGDCRNHHVHLLMTTRQVGPDGLGAKVRILDDKKTGPEEVTYLRERVAALTNEHLAQAGVMIRVDHRTLDAQAADAAEAGDLAKVVGLAREPTVHQGRVATAMKRRGQRAERTEVNRQVLIAEFLARTENDYRAIRVSRLSAVQLLSSHEQKRVKELTLAGRIAMHPSRPSNAGGRHKSKGRVTVRASRQALVRLTQVLRLLIERFRALTARPPVQGLSAGPVSGVLSTPSPTADPAKSMPPSAPRRSIEAPAIALSSHRWFEGEANRPKATARTRKRFRTLASPVSAYDLGDQPHRCRTSSDTANETVQPQMPRSRATRPRP